MKNYKVINRSSVFQLLFFFTAVLIVIACLFNLPRLAIPLGISYVLFLVVNPIVPKLIKLGLNKTVSVLLVFAGLVFFFTYPVVKMIPTIKNETENFQYYIPKVESYIRTNYSDLRRDIKKNFKIEIGDKALIEGVGYAKDITKKALLNIPKFLASLVEWVFIVPLFLFFFLKDSKKFKGLVLRITPNVIFERFYYLFFQFNKKLGDYIFAKFVEASIVGVIITSGLVILDVRFSILLGIFAGIANIIPYLGPLLGLVPAVIVILAEQGVTTEFWIVMMLYSIANAIDLALVFPILVSKIVDIHPILVVISVILGSQYFGVAGMIVSIPLAAAVKLIVSELYNNIYSVNYNRRSGQ